MMQLYIRPDYEVVRNEARCIACRVCERQCANEVHSFDPETGLMRADESKCVNCHRCVSLCPTHALNGRRAPLLDGQPQALPRVLG